MRYENPFYMAEDAGAADLIAGGRLQLGISRGSPEQVIDGLSGTSATSPARARTDADMARRHTEVFLELLEGRGLRRAEPEADVSQPARAAPPRAALAGPAGAHLVGRRRDRHRGLGRQSRG